jgi:hypothetical protein
MSRDLRILRGDIAKDHVHLLVSSPPSLSVVAKIVQYLKGRSSRLPQEEFCCRNSSGQERARFAIVDSILSQGELVSTEPGLHTWYTAQPPGEQIRVVLAHHGIRCYGLPACLFKGGKNENTLDSCVRCFADRLWPAR